MPEWVNIIVRSVVMYGLVVTVIRIAGRKQVAQMTFGDFVVGITVGAMAALISLNMIKNLAYGLLGLGVWLLLPILASYLSLKSKWFHDLFYGRETILIKHGKILEDNLKEVKYTGEELLSQLRRKNVFNLADVEFAVMEATGDVSVMLKSEQTPITPKHLEWRVASHAEPQTVILDGNIMDEALRNKGLNRVWLKTELDKAGISQENVFIGQVDASGDLYVDLFDDAIQVPKPSTKDLLFATIKKCEADLELYALATRNEEVKKEYQKGAELLSEVVSDLRIQLKR